VLFTPPSSFKAGVPGDYAMGEISEKYKKDFRVWIVRDTDGFYAIYAKCTHLGCTPRWLAAENKFKCPCHGSGYYKDGVNFEGPAPRPMDRVRIVRAEDGQIVVDTSVKYKFGTWDKPGAFLKI
jgi:cytochrome b6-f complex iron-sulfur subunit